MWPSQTTEAQAASGSPRRGLSIYDQASDSLTWQALAWLETLTAPSDGVLTLVARTYPVRPGDWAFGVADTTAPNAEWVKTG